MNKANEKGYILITVLLLLLVLTIVGMAAINTSTVENMLSGNTRLRERNVAKADAGIEVSIPTIRRVVREQDIRFFTNLVQDANLVQELRAVPFSADNADSSPDISYSVNNDSDQQANVDIDKMYVKPIGSVEFAGGHEGLGKGSGLYIYYRINATGQGLANSEAQVGTIYRYVDK